MQPKLSIITINLNNRDGLSRTAESIEKQSFTDYEWIVVDGGSSDGSLELIEQHAEHIRWWISEPDKGVYNAMNKGMKHAEGEWLLFLNSGDSLYAADTLSTLFSRPLPGDVVYGDVVRVMADGSQCPQHFPDNVSLHYFTYKGIGIISHQATFFKSMSFKNRQYDERYSIVGDWAYCIEAVLRGMTFSHVNQYIAYYDNNGMSARLSGTETYLNEKQDVIERYVPIHVRADLKKLDEMVDLQQRRSTRILMSTATKTAKWLNRILGRLEKKSEQ